MKLNYTVKSIKIKSNWFDMFERKKNTFQKITHEGLFLYFNLYKFKIHNQEKETFITSISMLRKETGYSTKRVFELLKKLKSAKVIDILNVSRWDYLLNDDGSIKDKDILMIIATDIPVTDRVPKVNEDGEAIKNDKGGIIYIDKPIDEDNYYLTIPFDMLEFYFNKGMNERHFAMYCLFQKWNKGYIDRKVNMRIEKIANVLNFHRDTVHRLIYDMNRNYVLASYKKRRKANHGYFFEHYVLENLKEEYVEWFVSTHKHQMDKLVERLDKKRNNKKNLNIEEEIEIVDGVVDDEEKEVVQERKLAFGTIKAQNNKISEEEYEMLMSLN